LIGKADSPRRAKQTSAGTRRRRQPRPAPESPALELPVLGQVASLLKSPAPQETEIKLRAGNLASLRRRLRALGFRICCPRLLERNLVFDTSEAWLQRRGQLLRLRSKGSMAWLTWKGPSGTLSRHKTRAEIETGILDGHALEHILERLGFRCRFEYEKYRTEFRRPGEGGLLLLDETPIGNFIEIEGKPSWIDRTATELGYTAQDYILASYGLLFWRDCERKGIHPANMLFERKKALRAGKR